MIIVVTTPLRFLSAADELRPRVGGSECPSFYTIREFIERIKRPFEEHAEFKRPIQSPYRHHIQSSVPVQRYQQRIALVIEFQTSILLLLAGLCCAGCSMTKLICIRVHRNCNAIIQMYVQIGSTSRSSICLAFLERFAYRITRSIIPYLPMSSVEWLIPISGDCNINTMKAISTTGRVSVICLLFT